VRIGVIAGRPEESPVPLNPWGGLWGLEARGDAKGAEDSIGDGPKAKVRSTAIGEEGLA